MRCCSECFTSTYLKDVINSNNILGNCDFCNSQNVSVYNPEELTLFFQNILDLYLPSKNIGSSIEEQIEKDFKGKIFSPKITNKRKDLLAKIIANDFSQYKKLFKGKILLKHQYDSSTDVIVKPLQISWERFADEIKAINRFHLQNALDLEKLKILLSRYVRRIPKGKLFFRARISDSINGFATNEMGCPPKDKTKGGRANPPGISYLYLGDSIKTTLYETRATLFDYVSIGHFQLKEEIEVINLRGDTYDPILLADRNELEDFLVHLPFIAKLEQELSKPRRRSDNELDYLPTQYLSEFIKSMGFHGVEYQSSLFENGYNLAIFNSTNFTCKKVEVYEIDKIDLLHKSVTQLQTRKN